MSTKLEVENEVAVNDNNKSHVHNFQIRPTHNQKFKTHLAKEAIQETLLKHLKDKEYSQIQAEVLSKTIASEIKDRLKDQCLDTRYKLMVQVVLGERHGAGTKVGARCIWDADTDTQASDQFLNETIFCMAAVFAVYFY
ncbi:dynein light chain Tctex-type protein 2B-like isoform X2 [Rhopalosiphum padi]|nr:dynein light chain Tctex-type protein 2B-like isoform X2 [Rhopalosiphum padi]XP_060841897.1 dynein light chain Tctex-type protein 2B-like isoform X2 [Rhopalosiphum padi]